MIGVLVVDDHPAVAASLSAALDREPGFRLIGHVRTAEQALLSAASAPPDVLLMELRLPGMGGAKGCMVFRERHPRVRTISLIGQRGDEPVLAAFAAGARGVLTKLADPVLLRQAVRVVATGGMFIDPALGAEVVGLALRSRRGRGPFGLTFAELRVLRGVAAGLTNREIAASLDLAEPTIKTHVRAILRKLGARDRHDAANIARERQLT